MARMIGKVQVGSLTVTKVLDGDGELVYDIILDDDTSITINSIEFDYLTACMKAIEVIGE